MQAATEREVYHFWCTAWPDFGKSVATVHKLMYDIYHIHTLFKHVFIWTIKQVLKDEGCLFCNDKLNTTTQ